MSDEEEYYDDGDDSDFDVAGSDDDSMEEAAIRNAVEKGKSAELMVEFEPLTPSSLQRRVDQEIEGLAGILGLRPSLASILLRQFRWNRDRLLDQYSESYEKVFSSIGDPNSMDTSNHSHQQPPFKRARLSPEMCGVCCEEFDDVGRDMFALQQCGHIFCRDCWRTYVSGTIREGNSLIGCMHDGCKLVLDQDSLQTLADVEDIYKYLGLVAKSYVTSRSELQYCPAPDCENAILCTDDVKSTRKVPTVICAKNHSFCFGCGLDSDHRPLICPLASQWLKSARDDSGSSQWIAANTRSCPKCGNNIEKSGGCNRILCRFCRYQFCWMCRKSWDTHGYNDAVCAVWKEPAKDENMTAAQANLEKWLFYFDRYTNHEKSARNEAQLLEHAEESALQAMEAGGLTWLESRFMHRAVEALSACRASLKWTYAMAHFMKQDNQKIIFEDLQKDLEAAVEALSQLLEEPIQEDTIATLKQKMIDKTVYVEKRHEVLVKDSARGLLEGRWSWSVPVPE